MKPPLLISLIVYSIACTPSKTNAQMTGVWQAILGDTLYSEIVILQKQIHSEKGNGGDFLMVSRGLFYYSSNDILENALMSHEFIGDSLFLFSGGSKAAGFRVRVVNDREMYIQEGLMKLHMTRVPEEGAMEDMLSIDTLSWNDSGFKSYLEGYHERNRKFESDRSRR